MEPVERLRGLGLPLMCPTFSRSPCDREVGMANRRFEMYQYRQVLSRLRLGESSRAITRSGLMGRRKVEVLREVAVQRGWLDSSHPLPATRCSPKHCAAHPPDRRRSPRFYLTPIRLRPGGGRAPGAVASTGCWWRTMASPVPTPPFVVFSNNSKPPNHESPQ